MTDTLTASDWQLEKDRQEAYRTFKELGYTTEFWFWAGLNDLRGDVALKEVRIMEEDYYFIYMLL